MAEMAVCRAGYYLVGWEEAAGAEYGTASYELNEISRGRRAIGTVAGQSVRSGYWRSVTQSTGMSPVILQRLVDEDGSNELSLP